MARTQDTRELTRRTEAPENPHTPPTPAPKAKTAPRGKRFREVDDTTMAELGQPAQAKRVRTTTSNPKRQRKVDNAASAETELAAPTKKAKTAPKKMTTTPKKKKDMNISPRRSNRTQANAPATPQRRKRRTKEEIAADKAKADAEKRQKEELIKQNRQEMMQMDIDEDIDRAETAAQTIRTFADLDRKTESDSDVEEFVGYLDVSSSGDSDSDSNDHAENAVKLKVSFLGQFVSQSTHLT